MTARALFQAGSRRVAVALIAATAIAAGCSNATSNPAPALPAGSPGPATAVVTAAPPTRPSSTPPSVVQLRTAPGAACVEGGTGTDCVAPGTYALDASIAPVTITLDVPRGWFEWDPGGGTEGLLVSGAPDAPDGSGWGVIFSPLGTIFPDPCHQASGTPRSAGTVDAVVAAMMTWPGFTVSQPKAVTLDGRPGKVVEVTATVRTATCPLAGLWTTPSGMPVDAYPLVTASGTHPTQYWIVDVDGTVLMIRATDFGQPSPFEESQGVKPDPKRHAQDQLALRAILQSIRFTAPGS